MDDADRRRRSVFTSDYSAYNPNWHIGVQEFNEEELESEHEQELEDIMPITNRGHRQPENNKPPLQQPGGRRREPPPSEEEGSESEEEAAKVDQRRKDRRKILVKNQIERNMKSKGAGLKDDEQLIPNQRETSPNFGGLEDLKRRDDTRNDNEAIIQKMEIFI